MLFPTTGRFCRRMNDGVDTFEQVNSGAVGHIGNNILDAWDSLPRRGLASCHDTDRPVT